MDTDLINEKSINVIMWCCIYSMFSKITGQGHGPAVFDLHFGAVGQ